MELILVVVISAGMAGNSQNSVSRSLRCLGVYNQCHQAGCIGDMLDSINIKKSWTLTLQVACET